MARKEKKDYLIQSVSLACSLLEQFNGSASELKLSELTRLVCASKNNVFRLLATLEDRNFIEKNATNGAYHLGITTLKLGERCLKSRQLTREAHNSLEAVYHACGETSFLAVLGSGGLVCGDTIETVQTVKVVTPIGTCLPLDSTAAGKVILACCSDEELNVIYGKENVKKYREQKITCLKTWSDEQDRIRKNGFAISIGEYENGANAVAAAIRNHASQVIGVICVAGPNFRLSHEKINHGVASLVVNAAKEISLRMGYVEFAGQKLTSQVKQPCFDILLYKLVDVKSITINVSSKNNYRVTRTPNQGLIQTIFRASA